MENELLKLLVRGVENALKVLVAAMDDSDYTLARDALAHAEHELTSIRRIVEKLP